MYIDCVRGVAGKSEVKGRQMPGQLTVILNVRQKFTWLEKNVQHEKEMMPTTSYPSGTSNDGKY